MDSTNEFWSGIQKLETEKRKLLSSKEYRLGLFTFAVFNKLKHRKYKSAMYQVRDAVRARRTRKLYNYSFEQTDNPSFASLSKQDIQQKTVMYTAIIGKYDNLQVPIVIPDNVRYVLYTDSPESFSSYKNSVEIRKVPENILEQGAIMANRYLKFHPKELFPEEDIAIYMDGNVRAVMNLQIFNQVLNVRSGIAMHRHADRDSIFDEAEVCVRLGRGIAKNIYAQINRYRSEGFPEHFGMNEATIIVSDLHNEHSSFLLNQWWREFVRSGSFRDQLAWPYVLWTNGYDIREIGNLGYGVSNDSFVEVIRHN